MHTINIAQKLSLFSDHFNQRVIGEVNDMYVKVTKMQGEFMWHHHQHEDELFLVVKGAITMRLRTGDVRIGEGEFFIVPKGVEHMPVAEEEAHVILLEPKSTLNTGNVRNERTLEKLGRV